MQDYPIGMKLRPLSGWPHQYTAERRRSPFSATWGSTMTALDRELEHLSPHGPRTKASSVLQIALREQDFRRDGMPRANAIPTHPGVILNITSKHGELSYPCDTFTRWQDNLRAIALGLESLRRVERYGITQTGQQYRGWQALEAAPTFDARAAACSLLARTAWPGRIPEAQGGLANEIADSPTSAEMAWKLARRNAHPDRHNGDQTLWDQVEAAAALLGINR